MDNYLYSGVEKGDQPDGKTISHVVLSNYNQLFALSSHSTFTGVHTYKLHCFEQTVSQYRHIRLAFSKNDTYYKVTAARHAKIQSTIQ